jgi:hypothetical protein
MLPKSHRGLRVGCDWGIFRRRVPWGFFILPGDNDPSGMAQALERIAALETELAAQRRQFERQIAIMQRALGNTVEFLKGSASKDDIAAVREGIIAASEAVRANVADVISATVRKVANRENGTGTPAG